MSILLALIPPLTWGATGIIGTKLGGSAAQQTFGESCGALILGLGVYSFFVIPNGIQVSGKIWLVGLGSGLFWAVGTAGQFIAYKKMGVSAAFPLSTAAQIVANALLAASILGEWATVKIWAFGILSIALVTIGALAIAARSKAEKRLSQARPKSYGEGLLALLASTIGFALYFIFPNLLVKFGFISHHVRNANNGINYMTAMITPPGDWANHRVADHCAGYPPRTSTVQTANRQKFRNWDQLGNRQPLHVHLRCQPDNRPSNRHNPVPAGNHCGNIWRHLCSPRIQDGRSNG